MSSQLRNNCRNVYAIFSEIGYTPSDGQLQFHLSNARNKVLIAGTRYGKTMAAAYDVIPDILDDNTRGWIVGPSYELASKEFNRIYDALHLRLGLVPIATRNINAAQGMKFIKFAWGSEVTTKSVTEPENLKGEEVDWMIISEGSIVKRVIWDRYLRPRLASRQGRLIIPCTPSGPNWIEECYLRGQSDEEEDKDWDSWQFESFDNPHFPESREMLERETPEDSFRQQYLGQFVRFSSLVYRDFKNRLHVVNVPGMFPDGTGGTERIVEWFIGIDWGYTNPAVVLKLGIDGDGRIWVADEWYETHQLVDDQISAVKRVAAPYMLQQKFDTCYCDPSEPEHIYRLRSAGIPACGGKRDIRAGIDAVRARLRLRKDGYARLFICKRCKETIREMSNYHNTEEHEGKESKEQPVKIDDHAMDALRYGVFSRDSRTQVRSGYGGTKRA